ncbi:MAG: carboxypeptidase regulatory-like domain-containing protein, partial [Vicinamibacteraceae bacterium]
MPRSPRCVRAAVVAALLALATPAGAQFALRSRIEGTITDSGGAAVPGATVTLTETTRNQTQAIASDDQGAYAFSNLASGVYTVTAELSGFVTAVSPPATLGSAANARVDLVLKIGDLSETVQVTREAPLVQTDHIAVGVAVGKTLIDNIASKGRNFTSFVQLAPGISTQPRNDTAGTNSVGAHHVIGGIDYTAGGGGNNGFYVNGVNANDNYVGGQSYSPSLEAVEEIKVDVANFSAANGRDLSTLSVTTRAGTNRLHGSVYDYVESSTLNAWDPLEKQRVTPGTEKPSLNRHQFGGNGGGPIVKNKIFFFGNYEQTYNRRGEEPEFFRVPTAAERRGDFSGLLQRFPGDPNYVLHDPFTTAILEDGETVRAPVPNNDLRRLTRPNGSPAIDPRALDMLNLFPLPNYTDPTDPDNLANHQSLGVSKFTSYRIDARVDLALGANDNLYVNVARSNGRDHDSGGLFPEITSNVEDASWMMSVSYARVFTPALTNELVVAYGKGKLCVPDQQSVDYMHQTDTLRATYFQNLGSGADQGIYAMALDGYYDFGPFEAFCASNPSLQISSNMNWVKGAHSVKAGFNFFR